MGAKINLLQPAPTKPINTLPMFEEPSPAIPLGRTTCRVCGFEGAGNRDAILLCGHCLDDLDTAAANVANSYAAALARLNSVPLAFQALVQAPGEAAWWAKVEEARGSPLVSTETFQAAWAAARLHSTRGALVEAYEQFEKDYTAALHQADKESERYRRAEPQLEAARAAGYGGDLFAEAA